MASLAVITISGLTDGRLCESGSISLRDPSTVKSKVAAVMLPKAPKPASKKHYFNNYLMTWVKITFFLCTGADSFNLAFGNTLLMTGHFTITTFFSIFSPNLFTRDLNNAIHKRNKSIPFYRKTDIAKNFVDEFSQNHAAFRLN